MMLNVATIRVFSMSKKYNKFIDLIMLQTSIFWIRYSKYNRVTLNRTFTKIETKYGKIRLL